MNKILLVDVSSIFHRSYHALSKRFEATDIYGNNCIGTYGFFNSLFKVCKLYGPFSKFIFAIDVKGSTSERKSLDENYKSGRTSQKSEFYTDLHSLIHTYIPMLKIMPLGLKGYEADDIIASACNYVTNNSREANDNDYHISIFSGDNDFELCTKYTESVSLIKTQPTLREVSYEEIIAKWGNVDPNSIALLKAITGDSSDNIVGIKGFKLKKALKVYDDEEWIQRHSTILNKNLELLNFRDDLEVVPRAVDFSNSNLKKIFLTLNSSSLIKRLDNGLLDFLHKDLNGGFAH